MLRILVFSLLLSSTISNDLYAQFNEEWHTTINGQGDFSDRYTCVTTDASGNIYFGGSTYNPNQNIDFMVVKYNSNGTLAWKKTWNGTGNGPDEANAINFHNGNLYITGYLNSAIIGNDIFTLSLSTAGDSIWGNVFNDSQFNQYEQAHAIAFDANGNVIVCGESDSDPTNISNDDFLTIKYNSSGTIQWVQRFNDIGNTTDRAVAVVTDSGGNVYVTGRGSNGVDDDYVTIKYDASGSQVWLQSFDNGAIDRATDMGIDNADNIYVTGRSSNGNDDDFRTIKYSSNGLEQFNVAFDFVEDDRSDIMDVNPDGSFVIAGRSDANPTLALNYNYRIVKYNNIGAQQWTATYDNSAANDDIVKGIDLATDGSVVVTGYSDALASAVIQNNIVTILYNNSGNAVWTKTYSGAAGNEDMGNMCIFDNAGNVIVAGQSEDTNAQRDALRLQYNTAGLETSSLLSGIGDNSDNIRDIYVDANNNVFVAGYSVSKDGDRNMFVCKLNSAGDTLWSRQLNGTLFGSDEEANALDIDAVGNVIISGYTKNSGSSSDITIAQYDATGILNWSTTFNGLVSESDRSYDLTTDASGSIYITGKTDINNSPLIANDQVFTAKYNSNGTIAWSMTYDGGPGVDRGRFIRLAPSGNIYVIGKRFNGTDDDFLIIKYDNNGQQIWAQSFNGIAGNDDPRDAEIDGGENIYITGSSETSLNTGITDYFTLVCNSSGTLVWDQNFNGSGNGIDVSEGLEINNAGHVFVTGYSDNDGSDAISNDCVTIHYDNSGNSVWTHPYNGVSSFDDLGDDLSLDANGNVIVACHSNNGSETNINFDLVTLSLNPNSGSVQNTTTFSISDSLDVANVVRIRNGNLFLGGSTWSASGQRDMLIVKYAIPTSIANQNENVGVTLYPNPCSDLLHIQTNNLAEVAALTIRDAIGNIVLQQNVYSGNTELEISHLAPGFYQCQIANKAFISNQSFIKK